MEQITNTPIPSVLFKYRNWKNPHHQDLVTKLEIYLSSPESFNDPFDCKIPIRFDLLTEEDFYQKNIELIDIKFKEFSIDQKQLIAKKLSKEKKFLTQDTESLHTLKWRKDAGIISLSSKYDDILMWSHYANSHTGICVGLNTSELFNQFSSSYIDKVKYCPDYPQIGGQENLTQKFYKLFYSKAINWEYEDEYRISKMELSSRIVTLSKKTFNSIYIGCQTPTETIHQIKGAVLKHIGNINIFRAKVIDYKFGISFEKI